MAETHWTPLMVEERLVEAADVMRRLPEVRVQGHFNTWPKILHEFADLVGQESPRLKRPAPSSDAISRMEETLRWLHWLDGEDAKLGPARHRRAGNRCSCAAPNRTARGKGIMNYRAARSLICARRRDACSRACADVVLTFLVLSVSAVIASLLVGWS